MYSNTFIKIIFLNLLFFTLYGCSSINVNPNSRTVDCNLYKGNETVNESSYTSKLKTKDGRTFDVISFGKLEDKTPLVIHYGKGCQIDLINDVSYIEHHNNKQQKVVLRNGSEIMIGTYEENKKIKSPYNLQAWPLIITDSSGNVKYAPKVIHPFKDIERLDIRNSPLDSQTYKAFTNKRDDKIAAIQKKNKDERRKAEENRLKRIEQRKKEKEQERKRQQELNLQNLEKITNRKNIGIQICRDGTLTYTDTGHIKRQENGQLLGFLEDISPDRSRIKFSINTFATTTGRLSYYPRTIPKLDNYTAERGAIYWDKVANWYPCGN